VHQAIDHLAIGFSTLTDAPMPQNSAGRGLQAAAVAAMQLLHLPRPGKRGSGLPSPVLKFAWQRRQTYIFELDIMGRTPGSEAGRAAVYSACV
jgi:hypothetical protein